MPNIKIQKPNLVIDTKGDPAEVLQVKRLPGRHYDSDTDPDRPVWIVPILPGLGRALVETYGEVIGGGIADLIEEEEKKFIASLRPPIEAVDPWKVDAITACNTAMTYHLYETHKGDKGDYSRVHYPLIFGE